MIFAAVASIVLAINGPGGQWMVFNVGLMLLGVGVGSVIPTVSSRAIETVGTAHAGIVSGITFMCQLAGAALLMILRFVPARVGAKAAA